MTLVKWTPKINMFNVFDDVEKMINQAFGHSILNKEITSDVQPLLDVYETDSTIVASLDLPGVEKKDVEVSVSNGFLTLTGGRKKLTGGSWEGNISAGTSFGEFKRTFELTEAVVEDKIKAQFKNGVLKISLPKAEEVKPAVRNISVS